MATGYSNRTLSFLKRYPQATFAVTAAMLAASIFTITSETPVAADRKLGNTIFELLTSSGAAGHASGTTIFHIDTLGNTVASGSYTTQANKNCTVLKTTSSGTIVCSTSTFTTSGDNDARYVNTSGDSMTGALILANGSELHASGSLFTRGDLILNSESGAVNVGITFGGTPERLRWLTAESRFEFSDDLNVTGDLTASGTVSLDGIVTFQNAGSGNLIVNGSYLRTAPNGHITIRPEGNGQFRRPADITWVDLAATADATGSGFAFPIPDSLSGSVLTDWSGNFVTAGVTGTATWQIINQTDGCDLFSTKITIDSAEKKTSTAATPAVINTSCNTFTTDDVLILRTDVVQTTAGKGKQIRITLTPK